MDKRLAVVVLIIVLLLSGSVWGGSTAAATDESRQALLDLQHQGKLTMRAVRAYELMPPTVDRMALELRLLGVDFFNADLAQLQRWVAQAESGEDQRLQPWSAELAALLQHLTDLLAEPDSTAVSAVVATHSTDSTDSTDAIDAEPVSASATVVTAASVPDAQRSLAPDPQRLAVVSPSLSLGVAESLGNRVALLVGNSEYAHVPSLRNPSNDAHDVAQQLEVLGFQVEILLNADREGLMRALQQFTRTATGADMALVFFAGHGIEVDGGNWLVPVDARLNSDQDVEFETVPLELVQRSVSGARGLSLVILDACRDNPFVRSMQRAGATRSISRGLGRIEPVGGTLVAYAARDGTTADDGRGRNSPYTGALLRALQQPGLEVGLLFRQVRDQVLAETGNRQEPFTYGSLPSRTLYLNPPQATTATNLSPVMDTSQRHAARSVAQDAIRHGAILGFHLSRIHGLSRARDSAVELAQLSSHYHDQLLAVEQRISTEQAAISEHFQGYTNQIMELERHTAADREWALTALRGRELRPREQAVLDLLSQHLREQAEQGQASPERWLEQFQERFSTFEDR